MKKLLIPILALSGLSAQALTIDVDNAQNRSEADSSETISVGTYDWVTGFSDNSGAAGLTGTIDYQVTDLDLDGVGGLDTVQFTVTVSGSDAATTPNENVRTRLGRISYGNDQNRITDIGDTISFSIAVTDVLLDGVSSATWADASSAVFTNFFLGGTGSTDTAATINGQQFTFDTGTNLDMNIASSTAQIILNDPIADVLDTTWDGGNFRVDNFSFEINAIPEPSSYALLAGMLGLGYVMVRRRS